MSRSFRATVVAAALLTTAVSLLPGTATADTPPVLGATAALLPADASDAAVGPDGTTYVVGTTYKISPLEHNGAGTEYEAFVMAYAPDGTLRDSRYLGGSGNDYAHAVATTADGSVVVSGSTASTDFPTTAGNAGTGDQGGTDAYVTVLSSDLSTITASAMYGGATDDIPQGVGVDGTGTIWVTGWSDSLTLPVTSGPAPTLGGKDGFVLAFGPGLTTRPVSQRFGGTGYDDVSEVVGLPGGGAIFVGRTTSGADFPAVGPGVDGVNAPFGAAGTLDAYAARMTGAGVLTWSTRFGTTSADQAYSVALNPSGQPVIAGSTNSTSFPSTSQYGSVDPGVFHGFVTTLAATGDAIVRSTVLGGTGGGLDAEDVAVDAAGDVYVAATTSATSVPLVHGLPAQGGGSDVYAVKLSADGARIAWATELGSSAYERARTIVVDPFGAVTITGGTQNPDYPDATPSPATVHQKPGLVLQIRSTPHVTAITGPASTDDPTPSFALEVDVDGARTECRVDGASWSACDPAYTAPTLSLGAHTIEVRASDVPGSYGPVAGTTVTILAPTTAGGPAAAPTAAADRTAPQTTIAAHPGKRTAKAKARFRLRSSEAGSTFACKLDKRAWKTCGPGLTLAVSTGRHTLRVRATDAAGNTDTTPARFRWKRV